MGQLRDRVAIVTGDGRGMGTAMAVALANQGAHIVPGSEDLSGNRNCGQQGTRDWSPNTGGANGSLQKGVGGP